jgi:hypothetical protein
LGGDVHHRSDRAVDAGEPATHGTFWLFSVMLLPAMDYLEAGSGDQRPDT